MALRPDLGPAWLGLAEMYTDIGDVHNADLAYGQHIKCASRDPRMRAAGAALYDNRLPEAESFVACAATRTACRRRGAAYEQLVDDRNRGACDARLLRSVVRIERLRFHENSRGVRTASSQQVRQPIFQDGLDQWRNFEPWLLPLKQALGEALSAYPLLPREDGARAGDRA